MRGVRVGHPLRMVAKNHIFFEILLGATWAPALDHQTTPAGPRNIVGPGRAGLGHSRPLVGPPKANFMSDLVFRPFVMDVGARVRVGGPKNEKKWVETDF